MTQTRPRIVLTCHYDPQTWADHLGVDYGGGVAEAGGLPLALPTPYRLRFGLGPGAAEYAREMAVEALAVADGVLLTGGVDFDPETFGEHPLPGLGSVDGGRDVFEIALLQASLAAGVPTLGICRGIQALAVAAGGALYQDLRSQKDGVLKHGQASQRFERTHFVTVEPGTLLARLVGSGSLKVNSFHHQAVSRVPSGFRISAVAPDGVIEAIEAVPGQAVGGGVQAPSGLVLGVQWHPENLWPSEPLFLELFKGLVDEARRYHDRG